MANINKSYNAIYEQWLLMGHINVHYSYVKASPWKISWSPSRRSPPRFDGLLVVVARGKGSPWNGLRAVKGHKSAEEWVKI